LHIVKDETTLRVFRLTSTATNEQPQSEPAPLGRKLSSVAIDRLEPRENFWRGPSVGRFYRGAVSIPHASK
jgi:hypothetical protein